MLCINRFDCRFESRFSGRMRTVLRKERIITKSIHSILEVPRPLIVSLSVCRFVMSSVVDHEGGGMKGLIFSKSIHSILEVPRPLIVSLSVCRFVMSSVVDHEGGGMKGLIFF